MPPKTSRKRASREAEKKRAEREALSLRQASEIESSLAGVIQLIKGLTPSTSPDELTTTLDRCAIATEELSTIQRLVLEDAEGARELMHKVFEHLDALSPLLHRTEALAKTIKDKRAEVDKLNDVIHELLKQS